MPYPYYNYNQYQYPYTFQPNQMYNYSGNNNTIKPMEWVDGEIGAKAFQMPQGWPPETPIVLWDNSEKRIFLKSWNNAGMANPIQELDYEIKERTNPALLPANISGASNEQYATKDDILQIKQELRELMNSISNMNYSNNNNKSNNDGNNRNRSGN